MLAFFYRFKMLVYLKNPMSYTSIDGKRVYGEKYAYGSMGPTSISIESYVKHKDILKETSYTKDWLDMRFNKDFPNISFKISEINKLDYTTLSKIANLIGLKHHKGKQKPPRGQLIVLRKLVADILDKAS